MHHKPLEGQLLSTPSLPLPKPDQWHKLPTWVQTQPEALQHLEVPPGTTSKLGAQQPVVVASSPLSMQPEALQLLDARQSTIQQPGRPRSQTTVAPFTISVNQLSETAHRHKGPERFVKGPSSHSSSLKPSQELPSQQNLESLVDAFPEPPTVIKKEHDSLEYSQSQMPVDMTDIDPLIEQEFPLEQSDVLPQDKTNQQEIVDQFSGGGSEEIGRIHTELSKEMLQHRLWQQAGGLPSGGNVGQTFHDDTQQELFTDLGSVLTTCNASSSRERLTSEDLSPERTLTTNFVSEMQSELAQIVTLMQVVLCSHANYSPPFCFISCSSPHASSPLPLPFLSPSILLLQ